MEKFLKKGSKVEMNSPVYDKLEDTKKIQVELFLFILRHINFLKLH